LELATSHIIESIKEQNLSYQKLHFLKSGISELFSILIDAIPEKSIRIMIDIILLISTELEAYGYNDLLFDFAFDSYHKKSQNMNEHWKMYALLEEDLQKLAISQPGSLKSILAGYLDTKYISIIRLLLVSYLSNIDFFIDDVYSLLTKRKLLYINTRIDYYVNDSINRIYPILQLQKREQLRILIFTIKIDSEVEYFKSQLKERKGRRSTIFWSNSVGYRKHQLLSSIPIDYLQEDKELYNEFQVLNRKFNSFVNEDIETLKGGVVGMPLENKAYERMNQEQWLKSMLKFGENYDPHQRRDFLKGGILQHSRAFREVVKREPEKWLKFLYSIGSRSDISKQYFSMGLSGLAESVIFPDKIKSLILKYYKIGDRDCKSNIVTIIDNKFIREKEPEFALEILQYYLNGEKDDIEDSWKKKYYAGSPLTSGINSLRGIAAFTLSKNIFYITQVSQMRKHA